MYRDHFEADLSTSIFFLGTVWTLRVGSCNVEVGIREFRVVVPGMRQREG